MNVYIPLQLTLPNKLYLSSRVKLMPHFTLTKKNIFGIVLLMSLKRYDSSKTKFTDAASKHERYTETINLVVSEKIYLRNGVHLSVQDQIDFNQMVRFEMMEDFYEYMDYHFLLNKVQLRQCIVDWQTKCGIHEDALGVRTLEKAYERRRKEKINTLTMCRSISA